ncbi:MAG: OmpA family protein [Hyphomicrobiales bacterium]|nr:OmpA family protein [Hyphomicrobiales bacterium]
MNCLFRLVMAFVMVLGLAGASAVAQTKDDLVRSLSKPKTRSIIPPGAETTERTRALIDRLQNTTSRQITVEERAEIAEITKESDLPQIDLEIYFDYDSADIARQALPTLVTLGQALSDEALSGSVFLIAGHTDATGSDAYNRELSDRRAAGVKGFLIENFGLDAKALIAVGYGEEQLKLPDAPLAGENRRVQIVNLAAN